METKLTFWEKWYVFWGFGYRVNHARKEIHRLYFKHKNCNHEAMSETTSEYVLKSTALRLIRKFGYNGCRWCWPVADKG